MSLRPRNWRSRLGKVEDDEGGGGGLVVVFGGPWGVFGSDRRGREEFFFIICRPHINTSYVATSGKKCNRVVGT